MIFDIIDTHLKVSPNSYSCTSIQYFLICIRLCLIYNPHIQPSFYSCFNIHIKYDAFLIFPALLVTLQCRLNAFADRLCLIKIGLHTSRDLPIVGSKQTNHER